MAKFRRWFWSGGISLLLLARFLVPLTGQEPEEENRPVAAEIVKSSPVVTSPLQVFFLDVGQGDGAILITPNKKVLVIDAGPQDEEFDAGEEIVKPFLIKLGVKKIDCLIMSHAHRDHIGGVMALLDSFVVDKVYDPGFPYPSPVYEETLRKINSRNIKYIIPVIGQTIDIDPLVKMRFLWPEKPFIRDDPNNNSLVLKITYGKVSFLFTGDIEEPAETELATKFRGALRAQILKCPHHGSKTSSTDNFLDAVRPEIVVISCGRNNRYGHPHQSVLARYDDFMVKILRTDEDGTILITTSGSGYQIKKLGISSAPGDNQAF